MTDLPTLLQALSASNDPKVRAWVPTITNRRGTFSMCFALGHPDHPCFEDNTHPGGFTGHMEVPIAEAFCRCHFEDKLDAMGVWVEPSLLYDDDGSCEGPLGTFRVYGLGYATCLADDYPTRLAATIAAVVAVTGVEVKT